jgi:GNAT superfamily N-acetyltransferase
VEPEFAYSNVYDLENPHHSRYVKFLYDCLKERLENPEHNISHTEMPTWEQHLEFIGQETYQNHCIVTYEEDLSAPIGYVYLTRFNEIGLYVIPSHRGKGYGKRIIWDVIQQDPSATYYAHINPRNLRSLSLFQGQGFEGLQHTYVWKPIDAE